MKIRRSVGFDARAAIFRAGGASVVCALALVVAAPAFTYAGKKKPPVPKKVQGLVLDASDNPVPGAAVSLRDVQTGKTIAIYSDTGGNYEFTDLNRDHDYEVEASFKNMVSEVRKVSSFDNRNTIPMNLTLTTSPPK